MKKTAILLILLLFGMFEPGIAASEIKENAKVKVFVIPVEGDVEPAMAVFIARAIHDASRYPDALFVLEMDTFGGRVDAAFQIVDTMLNAPRNRTIAFVKTKAISAGALIALSCSKLVMRHNTTIGDCAPISISQEGGPQMLGEKFQSPLRAKFRTMAKRNGFPEKLSEAMVTTGMVVYEVKFPDSTVYLDSTGLADLSKQQAGKILSKKTIVDKGQLLTMDDVEAQKLGFSKMSVNTIEEMLENLGIKNFEIIRVTQNWSEVFVRFIATIAPILLIIGFAGIYIEYKHPGLILPGVVGGLCLGLVFFGQYLVGLGSHTSLLLIVLGIVLLGVEMFVLPGFGIAGIAGIGALVIGMILSLQGFVLPNPSMPWQKLQMTSNIGMVVGSFVAAFIASILFIRFVIPRFSQVVKGPYLTETLSGGRADSEAGKGIAVGDSGIVVNPLRPSGKVKIGEKVVDVVAEGDFVEKGAAVIVTFVTGNKITVSRKVNDDPMLPMG